MDIPAEELEVSTCVNGVEASLSFIWLQHTAYPGGYEAPMPNTDLKNRTNVDSANTKANWAKFWVKHTVLYAMARKTSNYTHLSHLIDSQEYELTLKLPNTQLILKKS
ncbi:hypothetical protein T265_06741 [Opisthorchis viverrini]|uniref:Uncharacterized protein n=1 Tax=Opisthorchis viverrini TaxID=6198 RepID=A0A074ZF16_OPIVI|nr:hypothetical protein T265_06741 [Opisthorchis viverrini]KER25886.1 hypothetical protein T265_06741 [Opisthorchis viverrini]